MEWGEMNEWWIWDFDLLFLFVTARSITCVL
jgi:hypothetical protein